MKKALQISNLIAFLVMLILNYLANTGFFNGNTMGSISARYENLFTPASYAFSIWGLIYLGLLGFNIYQGRDLFIESGKGSKVVLQIGGWFIFSCLANFLWILSWLYGFTGISVFIMVLLLFSLIRIIYNLRMELDDPPFSIVAFVWWPFSIYSGWVTLALTANIAAYLTKTGWDGFGLSEVTWTVIMICIAGIINFTITWSRNMREFALAGVWGLIAIAVANHGQQAVVFWAASVTAAILFVNSGFHAFKNRKYVPWRNRN